jgi:hypothetical protein
MPAMPCDLFQIERGRGSGLPQDHVVQQVRGGARHASRVARWTDAAPLAREGQEKLVSAGFAHGADEAMRVETLPTVLTPAEVERLFAALGSSALRAALMLTYGAELAGSSARTSSPRPSTWSAPRRPCIRLARRVLNARY